MQLELNWTWIEIQINWIQKIELNKIQIQLKVQWKTHCEVKIATNVGWFLDF